MTISAKAVSQAFCLLGSGKRDLGGGLIGEKSLIMQISSRRHLWGVD